VKKIQNIPQIERLPGINVRKDLNSEKLNMKTEKKL